MDEITDAAGAFGAEMVLKVRSPNADERALMKPGAVLVGMLNPFDAAGLQRMAADAAQLCLQPVRKIEGIEIDFPFLHLVTALFDLYDLIHYN